MRALVQRVSRAAVHVDDREVAGIDRGLLVLLGIARGDTAARADRLASKLAKLAKLRIFEDDAGRFDRSVGEVGGEVLCVSQFTLLADTRRGNRPSFTDAAPPEEAEPLYERVRDALGAKGGVFGASMQVALVNDGPVTLMLES